MPLFSYNRDIPDGPNNPSVDQPKMKINTNSTDDLIDVDHFSFDESNGGYHRQVTVATKNTPVAQTDPSSVIFTAQASTLTQTTASATNIAQEFYRNQNGIFLTNPIRAFVKVSVANAGVVTIINAFNISSVSSNGTRTVITINLTAGATNGTNYLVIFNQYNGGTITTTTNANQVLVTYNPALPSGSLVSFVILQV